MKGTSGGIVIPPAEMTLTEEECTKKWTSVSETLKSIDSLIKDLVQTHQKSAELDKVEIAKLHQAASFTMTELEKCKDF